MANNFNAFMKTCSHINTVIITVGMAYIVTLCEYNIAYTISNQLPKILQVCETVHSGGWKHFRHNLKIHDQICATVVHFFKLHLYIAKY